MIGVLIVGAAIACGCVFPEVYREQAEKHARRARLEAERLEAEENACLQAELDWRRTYIAAALIPRRGAE